MKNARKILSILLTMVFPITIISCSNNSNENIVSNNVVKKYTWGNNLPKGPYFEHVNGGITTDKAKSIDYIWKREPLKINLSKTLTNKPIKIDGIEYKPIKKDLKIKWKEKNKLNFYSSNESLIRNNEILRDFLEFKEVDNPNDLSFTYDINNNFKK